MMTASSGSFTSPNHPNNYPTGLHCSWLIKAPVGHTIELSFPAFSLKGLLDCMDDYVAVYDGDEENPALLLGKYCGTTRPSLLESWSNMTYIVFVSDRSGTSSGFNITFTTKGRFYFASYIGAPLGFSGYGIFASKITGIRDI